MNHLLIYGEFNENDVFITNDTMSKSKKKKRKKKKDFFKLGSKLTPQKSKKSNNNNSSILPKRYITTLIVSSSIAFIFTFSLISSNFIKNENNKISDKLNSIYNTTSLYSASLTSSDIESSYPYIIGKLEIDKINLNYTILSTSTDEYLDMSICRFAGPLPNEIGNLCIAGHNYINSNYFGRLKELNIGDNLKVYDLSNNYLEYSITNIYETVSTDLSCTSQDTNGTKQVTLVTCNNITNKRVIIVAKEI